MKKIILLSSLAFIMLSSSVYANVLKYSVKYTDTEIIISGTAEEADGNIGIEIINSDSDFNESLSFDISSVPFMDQIDFPKGNRSFEFKFVPENVSKNYKARLDGQDFTKDEIFDLRFITSEDFEKVYSELKGKSADKDDFSSFIQDSNNAYYLHCDEIKGSVKKDDVINILYKSFSDEKDSIKSADDMRALWNKCNMIALLDASDISSVSDIEKFSDITDETEKKWLEHIKEQSGAEEKFINILKKDKPENTKEFDTAFKEAAVLTVVRYPDGIGNVGAVISDFSDITGISKSGSSYKNKQFAGKDYSDINKLINDYKSAADQDTSSQGGSGGGNSSSKNSKSTNSSAIPMAGAGGTTDNETVKMNFVDLDTVPWAYQAISTLSDKGIINGRTDTRFMPDDPITREEFLKLCVSLMDPEYDENGNYFTDVLNGAWYKKYVNTGYKLGIINGKDNGTFGIGEPISRQDMAVILYNTLKKAGYSKQAPENDFSDKNEISSYANEAVSALADIGAVNGVGDGRFDPKGRATRAQAAKIIFGVLDIIGEEE